MSICAPFSKIGQFEDYFFNWPISGPFVGQFQGQFRGPIKKMVHKLANLKNGLQIGQLKNGPQFSEFLKWSTNWKITKNSRKIN